MAISSKATSRPRPELLSNAERVVNWRNNFRIPVINRHFFATSCWNAGRYPKGWTSGVLTCSGRNPTPTTRTGIRRIGSFRV
jgi:hypothetical protein